jgi:transposase
VFEQTLIDYRQTLMAQPIAPDYGQQFLLPPALEDWVPKDHPVRFLREFVDQQDLGKLGFAMPVCLDGRPPYAPSLLLKVWLYGYHHRLRSTRKLEAACRDHLALIWLTGDLAPDHNSLWRFWRDNRAALRGLFQASVRLAVKAGLVGLALQAVDGTKIQALASSRSGWTKANLEKLLAALAVEWNQTEKELEREKPSEPEAAYRLPKRWEDRQALREAVKAGWEQLQEEGANHYHPQEPEARRMKEHGQRPFGYNAQAVVDQSHGIVVACDVVTEQTDTGQLVPMVQQAQANTQAATPVLSLADGGYGSGAQVAQAQAQALEVLVHPMDGGRKKAGYSAHDFAYDAAAGTVTCPQKQRLDFSGQSRQKGQLVKQYRCHVKDCPAAALCKDKKKRRVIEIWPHTQAVQAMRQRLQQPEAQAKLSRRREIVEKHFGHIKQHDGFRRWTVGGIENVRTQWALLNLTMNLRVLTKAWKAQKPGLN